GAGALPDLVQDPRCLDFLHDCGLVFQIGGVVQSTGPGLVWVAPNGSRAGEAATIACGTAVPLEPGLGVSIRLRPEDVILAKPPCTAELSLTNQLPGVITHLTRGAARTLVTIDCGFEAPILAEVTERSVERLSLDVGSSVLAMMKAQALRVRPQTSSAPFELRP
ncbi:MAG: TOBE domain-containing protein, partial [Planctomycetota bacterium]